MISKWRVALIFDIVLVFLQTALAAEGGAIRTVEYSGSSLIPAKELREGTRLSSGTPFTLTLLGKELSRVDSLYFSRGMLGATVSVDTSAGEDGVDVHLNVSEGERTRIGKITIGGSSVSSRADVERLIGIEGGDPFDPSKIEASMRRVLGFYNRSGFPYAQVWLTGFVYRQEENEADLSFSMFEGEKSRISNVVFEGISKTDSSLALRTSRLRPGTFYSERKLAKALGYIRTAGYFNSVGEARLERRGAGEVEVVIPVEEITRNNLFQGAFGFSKKDAGDYILNGSARLELRNIAGKGRDALFSWLDNGERYSNIELGFTEPFLFSLPLHLKSEIRQVVQDTLYTLHSGGLYFRIPVGSELSLVAGAAGDRNVPGGGDLLRSVRQRYRLGLTGEGRPGRRFDLYLEGAYKRNYLKGDRARSEGQLLYHVEGSVKRAVAASQSVYLRLVSEAVFSSREINIAERFALGGANTLRGYRENQFRGERIVYTNLEYWFGEEGALYLFDDIGAFYRRGEGWELKNGVGFGLRSSSNLGILSLSFGVGDRLSLEGTRIHIALQEAF